MEILYMLGPLSVVLVFLIIGGIWWAIYNAVCVPLAIVGMLPAWLAGLGMASSSLLVVLNALRLSSNSQFERRS